MSPSDSQALQALLAQMRALYAELDQSHAGLCVLHFDAAIAALESHLRRRDGTASPGRMT